MSSTVTVDVSHVDGLGHPDLPLHREHVASAACREDRRGPRAFPESWPALSLSRSPGAARRLGHGISSDSPAGRLTKVQVSSPRVPQPQLSVEDHIHEPSLPHQVRPLSNSSRDARAARGLSHLTPGSIGMRLQNVEYLATGGDRGLSGVAAQTREIWAAISGMN